MRYYTRYTHTLQCFHMHLVIIRELSIDVTSHFVRKILKTKIKDESD